MDLTKAPFIDHHCHPFSFDKAVLGPDALAREFYHGRSDIPNDNPPRRWGDSPELKNNIRNMEVIKTLVRQLSRILA